MSLTRNRVIALVVVAVALAAAPGAAAAVQLPTGQSQGVKIVWKKGSQVIVFGKRAAGLYKKIAGRKAIVSCWHLTDSGGNGGANPVWAPRRGRVLRTGDGVRDWDYCSIWRAGWRVKTRTTTVRHPRQLLVLVPLTQAGAVYLDEQEKAFWMSWLLMLASVEGQSSGKAFRSPEGLLRLTGGSVRMYAFWSGRHTVVALDDPDETPPAEAVGYYSDGAEHAVAVVLSASGRRLFVEYAPGGVLRTNVADHLYGDLG